MYSKVFHPEYFFQTVAPFSFLTGIAFVITGWRINAARNFVLMSLAVLVAAELLTFLYIYPRLGIMFGEGAASQSVEALRQAGQQCTNADRIGPG